MWEREWERERERIKSYYNPGTKKEFKTIVIILNGKNIEKYRIGEKWNENKDLKCQNKKLKWNIYETQSVSN